MFTIAGLSSGTSDYDDTVTKQNEVTEYECQIDKMVYELYKLTPEEIKIIENLSKK